MTKRHDLRELVRSSVTMAAPRTKDGKPIKPGDRLVDANVTHAGRAIEFPEWQGVFIVTTVRFSSWSSSDLMIIHEITGEERPVHGSFFVHA